MHRIILLSAYALMQAYNITCLYNYNLHSCVEVVYCRFAISNISTVLCALYAT